MTDVMSTVQDLFRSTLQWPESSVIRVRTSDDQVFTLQIAILTHRWPLFAQDREAAIRLAESVTANELKAVLLYAYSDLPAKRTLVEIFKRFQLEQPQSLPQSTFVDDMRRLMHDTESADFFLFSADEDRIAAHRSVLAARSRYFRSLFLSKSLESVEGGWRCFRPISLVSLQFFVEYVYTGQIASPTTLELIPLCWLVRYLLLSGEKEVENIVISALARELGEGNVQALHEAALEWQAKGVIDMIEKYSSTRK
jgi:hypothetical protein